MWYVAPALPAALAACRIATRKWSDTGSLRDLVYSKQRPKSPFAEKYARENGRPLPLWQVQTYGRHILEVGTVYVLCTEHQ